ncbi:MAG: hypothetical protein LEGION0403_FIIPPAGN_01560 [Legionella sp.]|uniref:hypothetical protein n=1 Tax=Legionella sp. TaxID=459 RepID=UPI003D14ABE4
MQSKLEQLFSTPPSENDRFRSNNPKKITQDCVYSIHSLATLGELLAEKKKGGEVPDLRYLVGLNGEAWFARESHTKGPIAPAHYKMTGSPRNAAYCKTAGNLFFSDDYSTLLKLNNKSGDFRPSLNSIKWILAIFVANEAHLPFRLPEVLIIEEQGYNGKVIDTLLCPIADIKKWLKTFTENTALTLSLQNQNSETKEASYSSEGRSLFADRSKGTLAPTKKSKISKTLAFEDDSASYEIIKKRLFEDVTASHEVPKRLLFEGTEPSEAACIAGQFEQPIWKATTYTTLENSSLLLFGSRLAPKTRAPQFPEQERSVPQSAEESVQTAPARKKTKLGRIDFISPLTQPSELETDEANPSSPYAFI